MIRKSLSVIMQNYNHAHFIREALDSVFSQSRRPDEVVVLDDGSTDDSIAVIESYAKDHPTLKLHRNDGNKGVMYSVNKCIRLASCDYIHALGADDKILPGFYEKSMALLERHPGAAVCTALSMVMDEDGGNLEVFRTPVISRRERFLPPDEAVESFRRLGGWFSPYAVIFDRKLALDMGMYDTELILANEGAWFTVMAARRGICFIPEPLTVWRKCLKGFAFTGMKDFDLKLEIVDRYDRWFREKFPDAIPDGFVDLWRRRSLSGMVYGILQAEPDRVDYMRRLIEHISPRSRTVSDRVFLAVLRAVPRLGWCAAKLYLFWELPFVEKWRTLGRKLARPFGGARDS